MLSCTDGALVDTNDGAIEGKADGTKDGPRDGTADGTALSCTDGAFVDTKDGPKDGTADGDALDSEMEGWLLSVSSEGQNLHVARQVLATEGFLHSILIFFGFFPTSQGQSLSRPFLIKNVPSESEHFFDGHMPQALGQCEASTPDSEHEVFLLNNIDLHAKGILLPPVVSSRISSGESLQGGESMNPGMIFSDSSGIIRLVSVSCRIRLSLAIETPPSEADAIISASVVRRCKCRESSPSPNMPAL